MRGVPEGRGESQPQFVFAEMLMKEERCTAYSPLAFGHPPLVNEGGKKCVAD